MSVRIRKPYPRIYVNVVRQNSVHEVNLETNLEVQVPKRKKKNDEITESSGAGTAP